MNNKKIASLILIGVITLIFLSGCVESVPAKQPTTFTLLKDEYVRGEDGRYNYIKVIHDDQLNVTCWTNWEMTHGGISCIPDSQLK